VNKNPERRLRRTDDQINALLDSLDAREARQVRRESRASPRISYRVRGMVVAFPQAGRDELRLAVPSRNVSRDGVAFLNGTFVYPGTRCRVSLVTVHDHVENVEGVVVRCRYLEGSGSIYEVGVRFDHPIDVALFDRSAAFVRVLVADESTMLVNLVRQTLSHYESELICAESAHDLVERALAAPFDLILVDLDSPAVDGLGTVKTLRERGYVRPIVAVARPDEQRGSAALAAGFDQLLSKPVRRSELFGLVATLVSEPLISEHSDDPEMVQSVDAFVASIPAHLRRLQSSLAARDLEQIQSIVQRLKADAEDCGFLIIAAAAERLFTAAAAKTAQAIQLSASDLIRLCLSARPATATR
jgi:DNA-binding response OmpR family regulator